MKTAIIDNSLCNIDYLPGVTSEMLRDYVSALLQSGINLVEIDADALSLLPKKTITSEHFVFRVDNREELELAKQRIFAYVTVPMNLIDIIPEIKFSPVILEIPASPSSLKQLLKQLRSFKDSGLFSMVRIVGDFTDGNEQLSDFIKQYKKSFCQPIDVCPLDTMLFGMDTALTAYKEGVDSLTLCFGENAIYTSVEKFWFFLYTFYEEKNAKENFENICRAAVQYAILVNSIPRGVKNINDILSLQNGASFNIDDASFKFSRKPIKREDSQERVTVDELLDELEFNDGAKDELKRVLDDVMICLADYDEIDSENKSKLN